MKKILTLLLVFATLMSTYGQRWKLKRWEAVIGIGAVNLYGDIGTTSPSEKSLHFLYDYKITATRPAAVAAIRYRMTENQSLKFNFQYGMANADDKNGDIGYRGLKVTSNIIEPSFQYEFYFLKEDRRLKSSAIFNKRGMVNNFARTSMYAFGGLGGWISLSKHEGPEKQLQDPKHAFQKFNVGPTIPVGLGMKLTLDSRTSFGVEVGARYGFTDYVDGFASRYGSGAKDMYSFLNISYIYKVRTDRRGRPILFR